MWSRIWQAGESAGPHAAMAGDNGRAAADMAAAAANDTVTEVWRALQELNPQPSDP